jgi:fucose 4-O-acetylase-like acetyltransferase
VDFSNPLAGLLGQGWFLQYMMTAYLIFYFVADYALKTKGRFLSVNIALLAVTCVFTALEITLPWGIHAAPLIASMMLFGALFGQRKLLHKGTIPPEWNIPNTVAAFAIYLAFGLLYPKAGQFAAGILGHDIGFWDVFMTLLSAILGSYILVNISKVLERVPVVNTAMEWCGSNSLQILLIHMCFIRIFSNAFHIVRPPMGTEIEQTNGMTVLVCVLAVAATAAFVILFRAVKKSLRRKRERHEST